MKSVARPRFIKFNLTADIFPASLNQLTFPLEVFFPFDSEISFPFWTKEHS